MDLRGRLIAAAAFAPMIACGDQASPCDIDGLATESPACATAVRLAIRASGDLRPEPGLVGRILYDVERARTVDPQLADLQAEMIAPDRAMLIDAPSASIAAAWSHGDVTTGDAAIDAVLSAHHARSVWPVFHMHEFELVLDASNPIDDRVAMTNELYALGIGGIPTDALDLPSDVTYAAPSASEIDVGFARGWGDCYLRCIWWHYWTVAITADGATLTSSTGSPLP